MLIDIATVALVIYAALAWGSNTPWAMALFAGGSLLLLAARLIWDGWRNQLRLHWSWLYLPASGLLFLIGMQQLSPHVRLHDSLTTLPWTIEPHTSGLYFLVATGYVALGFSVVHGFRSRKSLLWLMIVILGFGIFEALYGLIQSVGGHNYVWGVPVTEVWSRGTLMNHNHYALLLNLVISVGVGYLYVRAMEFLHGESFNLRRILGVPDIGRLAWIIVWVALLGFAVLSSLSRMGTIAMLLSLGGMMAAGGLAAGGRQRAVLVFSILFAIIGLGLCAGLEGLLARFASIAQPGFFEHDRLPIWRDAWPMITTTIWFGKGLGSFMWTFPAYETTLPDIPAMYAHNDYLQILADLGIVGLALVIWAFLICLRSAKKNLIAADPIVRGIGLATLGILIAAAVQEVTDYSLYIPGVACMFIFLVALNERASCLLSESAPIENGQDSEIEALRLNRLQ
jgi:O-antigen ligase